MISMTVAFGPASGGAWHFLFKSQQSVDAAKLALADTVDFFKITDDFGQSANIRMNQIHGVLIDDLSQSSEAQIQRGLHEARTQMRAQGRGASDPELKGMRALHQPPQMTRMNG